MCSPRPSRSVGRGFTLLELLVVMSILALATAGVVMALRDPDRDTLQRDAERLAAMLEAGRAWSRSSGQAVRWVPQPGGFQFLGRQPQELPQRWLSADVTVQWPARAPQEMVLGPEPMIAAQSVVLQLRQHRLTLATDGLHPFTVQQP